MNANLQIAIEASLKAGKAVMEIYEQDFDVELKQDNSPITIADRKANDIITSFLAPTQIPIISEESKQTPYKTRKQWSQCWIVDPIDGTKEFIKRNGEFTVNIALVEDGKPILGVIYAPALKTLYFGDVKLNKSYKIIVSSYNTDVNFIIENSEEILPKETSSTLKIATSRSHINQETLDYLNQFQDEAIEKISVGSSLKFCFLSEGKIDIYPRFSPTMEWDTAAGHAICNAVGVEVIALDTKQSLSYNKQDLKNPNFIVSKKSR